MSFQLDTREIKRGFLIGDSKTAFLAAKCGLKWVGTAKQPCEISLSSLNSFELAGKGPGSRRPRLSSEMLGELSLWAYPIQEDLHSGLCLRLFAHGNWIFP
jgi:hypothetical protein